MKPANANKETFAQRSDPSSLSWGVRTKVVMGYTSRYKYTANAAKRTTFKCRIELRLHLQLATTETRANVVEYSCGNEIELESKQILADWAHENA